MSTLLYMQLTYKGREFYWIISDRDGMNQISWTDSFKNMLDAQRNLSVKLFYDNDEIFQLNPAKIV